MAKKTKTETTTTAKTKAPKQLGMGEGFDRKTIPEVEEAAQEYVKIRNKRMAMTENEVAAQAALDAALEKHRITKYFFVDEEGDEEEAYIPEASKPSAKVRKVKQAKAKADE